MRRTGLTVVAVLICVILNAQRYSILLDAKQQLVEEHSIQPELKKYHFTYPGINFVEVNTPIGNYSQMVVPGTYRSGKIGEPQLVSSQKIISIPVGAELSVKVKSFTKQEYEIDNYTANQLLIPYQESESKSISENPKEFVISEKAYKKNEFSKQSMATVEILGTMRGLRLAKLTINPVNYNPVTNRLVFHNNIEVELVFKKSDFAATQSQLMTTYSPYFNSQYAPFIPPVAYESKPDLVKQPVRYLIVSPSELIPSLQEFIQWKTQKGFEVIVANTSVIGNTSNLIKSWIKTQYADTLEGKPSPSFLLLVGDIELIPASQNGTSTYRATDLYYGSVDGDMFPDLYYGRLPAKNSLQLKGIINKILHYERYQFTNDSFLNDVTLIAGVDATWNPRVGQPTVKYGTENYFNSLQGFSTVNAYLNSYTGCYTSEKMSVGFVNYTAHCSNISWDNPNLTASTVSTFTNIEKYPLVIGNCCQSGDFSIGTSIGEAWINNPNGGAIAYIGSVPDTYWWEDFYWAVGAHAPVANNYPTVEGSSIGMFDAPFNSDYQTVGAFMFAGNLAVTEAHNSGYLSDVSSKYYWEAYHCLGDPSVIPYFTKGKVQQVSHLPKLVSGVGEFIVEALPGSQVTLSNKTEMLATSEVSAEGRAALYFSPNLETDSVKIVVTKPKYVPYIVDVPVTVSQGSYLALKTFSVSDELGNNNGLLDFNERAYLNFTFENVGDSLSQNIIMDLSSSDPYIQFVNKVPYKIQSISSEGIDSINQYFEIKVSNTVPDQHLASIAIQSSDSVPGKPRKYYQYQRQLLLNAPEFQILSSIIVDDFDGNGNEWADAGENISLVVGFINSGHSQVSTTVLLQSQSAIPQFQIANQSIFIENCNPGDTIMKVFPAQVINNPSYMTEQLQFSVQTPNYQKSKSYYVPIGLQSPKIIGTGTSQFIDYPFNNYYKNNRTQLLYTKEEINQGINEITALSFNLSTITPNSIYRDLSNFKIRISTTDINELVGFIDMANGQIVYNEPLYMLPATTGWHTFVLEQPFMVTSKKNIVIEISWGTTDNYAPITDRTKVYGSTTSFNSVAFAYHDDINPPPLNGITKNRPNIKILYDTLSILNLELTGNLPINNKTSIQNGKILIDSIAMQTDTLGRAKYFSNRTEELLHISANAYGYRDTALNWLKTNQFSEFSLQMERNPQIVFEVKNEYGIPVPEAKISINGYSVFTNLQGIYDCFGAEKDLYSDYRIEKNGYQIYNDSIKPMGMLDTLKITLIDDLSNVSFLVTNSLDNPISGASIKIDNNNLITDSEGKTMVEGLNYGAYLFTVESNGYSSFEDTIILGNQDTLLQIKLLTKGAVQFYITDGFLPLGDVTIAFADSQKYSNSSGLVIFQDIIEGDYLWNVNKVGYFNSSGSVQSFGEKTIIEIIMKPLPDITFYIHNGFTALNNAEISINSIIYNTDSDGIYRLIDVDSGFYSYVINKDGYASVSGSLVINDRDTTISYLMKQMPDLTFEVYNNNTSLEGVLIMVNSDSIFTNYQGKALIPDLEVGNYTFSFSKLGYYSVNKQVEIFQSDTLIKVDLDEIPDIHWKISSNDMPVDSAKIIINGSTYYTDIFGELMVPDLPGNTYNYQVSKPGYSQIDTFVIVTNFNQEILHQLEKYAVLKFFIVDNNNDPITDVVISLESGSFFTNSQGMALISDIPKGNYHYTISKENYFSVSDSISITADLFTEVVMLTLENYQVQFNVYTQDQIPIQDASITLNNITKSSNSLGVAIFNNVLPTDSMLYVVNKSTHYQADSGYVSIQKDTIINIYLLIISINDSNNMLISVYPNPTNNIISITSNLELLGTQFKIYNELGSIIKIGTIVDVSQTIDFSEYQAGQYYLNLIINNSSHSITIIKN